MLRRTGTNPARTAPKKAAGKTGVSSRKNKIRSDFFSFVDLKACPQAEAFVHNSRYVRSPIGPVIASDPGLRARLSNRIFEQLE